MKLIILEKKIASFLLALFLVSFFISCTTEENVMLESDNTSAKSEVLQNGDISSLFNAIELTGDFYVWNNKKSNEVVFYTKTANEIYFFSCQGCEKLDNQNIERKEGTLTFLDHAFLFQTNTDKLYFYVDKKEQKAIKTNFGIKYPERNAYKGFGIRLQKINKSNDVSENDLLSTDNILSSMSKNNSLDEVINSFNLIQKNAECESGGEGSSSCSSSSQSGSCSVSCVAGYYACCLGWTCNCVKVPQEIAPDN